MYLLALSAMALATGCSNDETTELNKGNAIDFSVTAGKMTREGVVTTSNIRNFYVWAFTDNQTYMEKTKVTNYDDKWTYTDTKFWPETPVDFYAININEDANINPTITSSSQNFEYDNSDGIYDVLYATNKGETKDDHKTAPVKVNFRHALSQIVFKAKLTGNSSIDVKIKQIHVDNVRREGTFTWAAETTGPNLTNENASDTEAGATWGEWNLTDKTGGYQVFWDSQEEITELKEGNTQSEQIGRTLFLMPQTLTPWLKMDGNNVKVNDANGARLRIKCIITDRTSGVQLWPLKGKGDIDGYGTVAISLDNPKNDPKREPDADGNDPKHDKWMQGKKYTYTLIFGEGGGYDPTKPANPDPVLVPITFDVTVDEFQNGGNYDLNASK